MKEPQNSSMDQLSDARKIAQGVGILTVVMGHTSAAYPLSPPVYMYHMPLFFFLGGMSLTIPREFHETITFLLKKFVFFILVTTVFYSIIAYFIFWKWGIAFQSFSDFQIWHYTGELFTTTNHNVSFALTNWFLTAYAISYFLLSCLLIWSHHFLPNARSLLFAFFGVAAGYIGVGLLGSTEYVTNWWQNLIAHSLAAMSFMAFGFLSVETGFINQIITKQLPIFITIFVLLLAFTYFQPVAPSMASSYYPSGVKAFFLISISSIFLIFWISHNLRHSQCSKFFMFLGIKSKHIMAHHLFAASIINVVLVMIGIIPPSVVSIYYRYLPNTCWPAYVIFGIAYSLAFEFVLRQIVRAILKLRKSAFSTFNAGDRLCQIGAFSRKCSASWRRESNLGE